MNKPIAMGNCCFVTWEQLDVAFDEWAKGYFGEHVRAEAAREENDCCLEIEGLEHKDFEKFSALFERFDKEGLYDPNYEFDTGVVRVQLPGEFARGILNEVFTGLRCVGSVQANDTGVFMMEQELDYWKLMNGGYLVEEMEDAALENGTAEQGAGWKVEPEVDELVVRLAHMAGELEARKEITAPEWDDLCGAIRDAIQEYYDNPSETNPFIVEDVAEKVFRERFAPVPDIEAIEKYFASVNLGDYGLSGHEFTQEDYRDVLEEMKSDGLGVEEAVRQYLLRVRRVLDEELDYQVATGGALLSMIPVMQRDGVTLAQVSEELNFREYAGVVDGSAGWDDSFIDYSTEELQFIESAWSKMEAEKGTAKMEDAVLDDLIYGAENLKVEQPFEGKGQDLGER